MKMINDRPLVCKKSKSLVVLKLQMKRLRSLGESSCIEDIQPGEAGSRTGIPLC